MIRDGIYKIAYPSISQLEVEMEEALAIVRRGRIIASDRHGGVYRGSGKSEATDVGVRLQLVAHVPPGGELATGFEGGNCGTVAAMSIEIDPTLNRQRAVIDIAGSPLEIDIAYLGPLPRSARRAIASR